MLAAAGAQQQKRSSGECMAEAGSSYRRCWHCRQRGKRGRRWQVVTRGQRLPADAASSGGGSQWESLKTRHLCSLCVKENQLQN